MLLFQRCKHDWKILKKTYASPAGVEEFDLKGRGDGKELIQRLTFGVTTVLVQCSKCHKIKKYEMLGKEEKGVNDERKIRDAR